MYFVVTWAALLPREDSHLPVGRVVCVMAHTLHPWEAEDFVCPGPTCAAVKTTRDHHSASHSPPPHSCILTSVAVPWGCLSTLGAAAKLYPALVPANAGKHAITLESARFSSR